MRQYPCAKNLQSQTASTKIVRRKIIGAKAARKMLMKLTPVDEPMNERRFTDGFASDDQQVPFGSDTSGNRIFQFLLLLSDRKLPGRQISSIYDSPTKKLFRFFRIKKSRKPFSALKRSSFLLKCVKCES